MRFLCKSFGILALLASAMALLSCRGPWLKEMPGWFVIVPFGAAIFLFCFGILLLLVPTNGPSSIGSILFAQVMVGLAALGGIYLTSYFHGDTDADLKGVEMLHSTAGKFLVGVPVLALIAIGSVFYRMRAATWSRRKNTPPNARRF